MNIVIPMAGMGKRFIEQGYVLPKPLIPIFGKPMYRYAVDCLPLNLANQVVFILRDGPHVKTLIQDIYLNYNWVAKLTILTLPHVTNGQAETLFQSAAYLNLEAPTLVHNCDTAISSRINWVALLKKPVAGAIVTFPSKEARWSYVKTDRGKVIDMQEKKVISSWATTGTYFFRSTPDLLQNIAFLLKENIRENNEFYLSTVYRIMLDQELNILSIPISLKEMLCFGTPEDLQASLYKMSQEKKE